MVEVMLERRVVNFTPTGHVVKHGGSGTAYANYGCRCAECTEANRVRVRRRQAERRSEVPPEGTHGKAATYTNWSCRCTECTAAHKDKTRAEYVARQERNKGK